MEHIRRKKRNELFLIGGLLLLCAASLVCLNFTRRKPAATVEVSIDGGTVRKLPLSEDAELLLESANGGTNRLIIKDGKALVTEASCPDKLCIRQGAVSESGQTIVCLPNKLVITIR